MQKPVRLDSRQDHGYFLRQKIAPWLFLLLPILFTLWLKYYPILKAAYITLFDYDPIAQPGKFVGLKNYQTMFQTQFYREAWGNTFVFLLLQIAMAFFIPSFRRCSSTSCARPKIRYRQCTCCRR